ncbi:serine-aspartate repeat-containing protein D-like isoform X2 [Chanodichthys erythropterus]|uniref:serine-aspartate repeat-containing protein D-like isoform X2 n=1 Tax=Chanodichthys erythropterus TaxID=933992 RepID=UPI00351DB950
MRSLYRAGNHGSKVNTDGFSDLFSPKKKPAQSSEDGDSDVDDQSRRASQANRPSPKRKKRGNPTTKSKDGFSDLFSPKKKPAQSSEDGDSDVDDQSRRASQANRPSPKRKKRGNPTTKSKDGFSDLFSPKKKPAQSSEDGDSDVDDQSRRASQANRPSPKRKKRGNPTTKSKDGFSDLFSPKKKPAQSSEDGDSDVDDQSRRASQANRPSPKRKKRGNPTTKSKETSRIIMKRTWREEERRAVNKRLGKFMAEHRVPGKLDCVKCLEEEEALKDRTWKDVKNFVHNTIVTLKRRSAARKIMF